MQRTYRTRKTRTSALGCALFLLAGFSGSAWGQVSVEMQGGQIIISNPGHAPQEAVQTAGKSSTVSAWEILDNVGNSYLAVDSVIFMVNEYVDDEPGGGGPGNPPGGGGGYQDGLDLLGQTYGAVIAHDSTLGVDLISFPTAADPYTTFFDAIVTDSVGGEPLMYYFGLVEITSLGDFDEPQYVIASSDSTVSFPNDPYFLDQWNLTQTALAKVAWHPLAIPLDVVRIAVIDSRIEPEDRGHEGLDGVSITHKDLEVDKEDYGTHALGVVSLLTDQNDDASGITSLLGNWTSNGGCATPPLLSTMPPEVYVYSVGDDGPISKKVAEALKKAIDDEVDIINLSLRMAYSPKVEELIQEALDANIIVVAAAGNYSAGASNKPAAFPANIPGVIAVGSAGQDLQYAANSANTGVDIRAPGTDLIVGGINNVWQEGNGTSYAAPHVTAALAFMRAVVPTLSPDSALAALQAGAVSPDSSGVGFLHAGNALNHILSPVQQVDWAAAPSPDECGASKRGADADAAFHGAEAVPETPTLAGNYPNPFNPETTIAFSLPERQPVRLAVYDALGRQVQMLVEGVLEAGPHEQRFVADDLPSGTYFTRLETQAGALVKSMVLTK